MEDQFGRLKKYDELSHRYDGPIPRDKLNELKCGGTTYLAAYGLPVIYDFGETIFGAGLQLIDPLKYHADARSFQRISGQRGQNTVTRSISPNEPVSRKRGRTSQSAMRQIAQEFDNNGTVCMGKTRALVCVRAAGNCHSIWSNSPQL